MRASGQVHIETTIDDFLEPPLASFFQPVTRFFYRIRQSDHHTLVHSPPCRRRRNSLLEGGRRRFLRSSSISPCPVPSLPSSNPSRPPPATHQLCEDLSTKKRPTASRTLTSTVVPPWPSPSISPSRPPRPTPSPSSPPFRPIRNVMPHDPLRCTAHPLPARAISTSRPPPAIASRSLLPSTRPLRSIRCPLATSATTLFPRLPRRLPALPALPPFVLDIRWTPSPATKC